MLRYVGGRERSDPVFICVDNELESVVRDMLQNACFIASSVTVERDRVQFPDRTCALVALPITWSSMGHSRYG